MAPLPLLLLFVVTCVQTCCQGCIPPLSMIADASDGAEALVIHFDSDLDVVEQIRKFAERLDLSRDSYVKGLEFALRHASQHSMGRNLDGDIFMHMDDKGTAAKILRSSEEVVASMAPTSFPLRIWSTATTPPFKIVLDGREEYMTNFIMSGDGYLTYKQLNILLRKFRHMDGGIPGVVVDVGANLGMISLYSAALGEDVVAFEATSRNADMLKASCVLNHWCPGREGFVNGMASASFTIFENAVSDSNDEEVTIRVNWLISKNIINGGGNTMFPIKDEASRNCSYESKRTITLDSALAPLGLLPQDGGHLEYTPSKHISILKLDCEGCEPKALAGASNLFKFNKPRAIMTEVNAERLLATGSSATQYLRDIESLGYTIFNNGDATLISPVLVDPSRLNAALAGANGNIDCIALSVSINWS